MTERRRSGSVPWRRGALAAALGLACGGSPPPAPPGHAAPPHVAHCPAVGALGPWAHEVFPACPAWPITSTLRVCAGTCPAPCLTWSGPVVDAPLDPGTSYVHAYDPAGRWLGWMGDGTSLRCRYDGARLAACAADDDPSYAHADRDADGRVVRVTLGATITTIAYEGGGRVSAIGDRAVRYDVHGRVTRLGDEVFEIDARGRVVGELGRASGGDGPLERRSYTYDARDRVTTIASERIVTARATPLPAAAPVRPPARPDPAPAPDDDRLDLGDDELVGDDVGALPSAPGVTTFVDVRYDGDRVASVVERGRRITGYRYDCR